MNVVGRPIKREPKKLSANSLVQHTVNLYDEPPSYELSLDEFEEYALIRLKVGIISEHEF